MRSTLCVFSRNIGRLSTPALLLLGILLFALQAGRAAAQVASAEVGTMQPTAQGQSSVCYLGGNGRAAADESSSSELEGEDYPQVSYQSSFGQGARLGQYSNQSSMSSGQSVENLQRGDYPQSSDESSFGQDAQNDQYADQPSSQEGQYVNQFSTQGDQYPSQSSMSTSQIIETLQQSSDLFLSIKNLAGQQYGVDPSTIPDEGVYNCIEQDSAFRKQVSTELVSQGYSVNPQQQMRQPGLSTGTGKPNQEYYPYSPSLRLRGIPPVPLSPQEQPSELRRLTPVPYPNLPSLQDLYAQEVPVGGQLRRFGGDVFKFGSNNTNLLPIDLPVGPDYILGPGDNLIVNMWGGQSARLSRIVDRQGEIALPEAGVVAITGLNMAQAQDAVQKALGTQFQGEHVELSLGRVRTVRVYVVGDVQRPGAYDLSSLSTPVNALYAAGGPTNRGSLRTLKQYRGKDLVQEIDLYDFLLHGVRSDLGRLLPGDTILVPPVGPQVAVAGMVRRPAIYELKASEDLKDVLNMAGGVLATADLQEIRVERVEAHEDHTMFRVQIPDGSLNSDKLTSFMVQDGDKIQVSPILPYNEKVVYLEGHVFKPGQYAWREGMTVADLIHSYQDVMPEPADHAEVVRLVPPDLHPETLSFNLPDELVGSDPVTLQPFDTVRVFGRYQVDPPKVSIYGPVLRPGRYPMAEGMTITDLVRMAGGFRRSAYHKQADLSSYKVEDGQKVQIGYSVVDIGKALDGDKSADVPLQPGDVVGIRQLTGWNDIGSSITIDGEVAFAGTFGIKDEERLSSVLKRAGGFRADAYPEGAVLERVQVRQFEENNRQEMIRRLETTMPTASQGLNGTSQDQLNLMQAMQQQRQEVLSVLRSHPSTGRMVIKISSNISSWENTPADIVVRAGDHLTIPKRPDFVMVSGQVYNATGITYRPGKDAGWYLRQAGGTTRSGDKKAIFVLRADGSVIGNMSGNVFDGGVLSVKLHPGDSVIVPEKIAGGSQVWRNVIGTAQIMSSVALTGAVAGVF